MEQKCTKKSFMRESGIVILCLASSGFLSGCIENSSGQTKGKKCSP
jgi:hypothetical protein